MPPKLFKREWQNNNPTMGQMSFMGMMVSSGSQKTTSAIDMTQQPSDVQFMDLSKAMQGAAGGAENAKARQCAACDSVSDSAPKMQCKAALSCP